MPSDGNWDNKEDFYTYQIIKNNQYIGRTDSLLIHRQGKKLYSLNHLFTMTSFVISNRNAAIALYKWALSSIKHLVKVYSIVRLLTCVASETKPNAYFSDCSHKFHLPAGTMDLGIETTCQRAAVSNAIQETGVTMQPVRLSFLMLDFLDLLQVQRRQIAHFTKLHVKIYSWQYIIQLFGRIYSLQSTSLSVVSLLSGVLVFLLPDHFDISLSFLQIKHHILGKLFFMYLFHRRITD